MANLVTVQFDKDTGQFVLGKGHGGGGIPAGFDFVIGYHHVQSVASNTWNIHHNGNTMKIAVSGIFDTTNSWVMPDKVEVIDPDNVIVRFASPMIGTANVVLFL